MLGPHPPNERRKHWDYPDVGTSGYTVWHDRRSTHSYRGHRRSTDRSLLDWSEHYHGTARSLLDILESIACGRILPGELEPLLRQAHLALDAQKHPKQ